MLRAILLRGAMMVLLSSTVGAAAQDPMAGWQRALARAKGSQEPLSIVCVGDSNTEGDAYTGALRRMLQAQFGDAGIGYVSFAPRATIAGAARYTAEGNWEKFRIANDPKVPKPERPWLAVDGFWVATSDPGASLKVEADHPAMVRVHYQAGPGLGQFAIRKGEKVLKKVKCAARDSGYRIVEFEADAFAIDQIKGRVVLLGADVRRKLEGKAGALVHSIGAGWGTANDFEPIEAEAWKTFMASTKPCLVVVALGTNDVNNVRDPDAYRRSLGGLVAKLKAAAPQASFMVLSAAEASWTDPQLAQQYAKIAAEVAEQVGGLFLDNHAAAGPGGKAWMEKGILSADNLHYTAEGGQVVASEILELLQFEAAKP